VRLGLGQNGRLLGGSGHGNKRHVFTGASKIAIGLTLKCCNSTGSIAMKIISIKLIELASVDVDKGLRIKLEIDLQVQL
jgi:hypothetical protein